jgi:hypothetical protein
MREEGCSRIRWNGTDGGGHLNQDLNRGGRAFFEVRGKVRCQAVSIEGVVRKACGRWRLSGGDGGGRL